MNSRTIRLVPTRVEDLATPCHRPWILGWLEPTGRGRAMPSETFLVHFETRDIETAGARVDLAPGGRGRQHARHQKQIRMAFLLDGYGTGFEASAALIRCACEGAKSTSVEILPIKAEARLIDRETSCRFAQ